MRTFKILIGVLILAVIPALLSFSSPFATPSALAADLMIDDFATGTSLSARPLGIGDIKTNSFSEAVSSVLGGERDMFITAKAEMGWYLNNSAFITFDGGVMKVDRQIGVQSSVDIQWDGDDHDPTTLDATGLGGVDLTDGGANDTLFIDIAANNFGVTEVTVLVTTDAGNASSALVDINVAGEHGNGNDTTGTYSVAFSDFEIDAGSGADFTNVGAIALRFDSYSSGAGPYIDAIRVGVLDETAPTTSVDVTGTVQVNGWFGEYPKVTLSATDNSSGVAATYFRVGNVGPWNTYNFPFDFHIEGQSTLYFYSVDNDGNEESPKSTQINVDLSAPTVQPTISGIRFTGSEWYTSVESLKYDVTENGSGVASFTYTINDGAPVSYTSGDLITSFGSDGSYEVAYTVTDKVGHVTTGSTSFKIDGTDPATAALLGGNEGSNGWYTSDVSVTLQADDDGSGVKQTTYTLDGAQYTYSGPFTVTGDGIHTIEFWSIDNAGNQEATTTQTIKIDTTAPVGVMTFNPPANANGWWNSVPFQYIATCTDPSPGSGVVDASITGSVTSTNVAAIIVACYDQAGNLGPAQSDVRIDTVKPIILVSNISYFYEGDSLVLDASESYDLGSTNLMSGIDSIRWDLDNDGTYESPDKTTITRPDDTEFTVGIQVTDNAGNIATTTQHITVLNAPPKIENVLIDNQQVTILATDPAGPNDTLTYSIDCDGDLQPDQGPQTSNVFTCPEGGPRLTGLIWVFDEDQGMITSPFEIINVIDLCANQWTGSLRVMTDDCGRSEIELNLPNGETFVICANQWNGAARYAFNGQCNRSEQSITYADATPIDTCVNQWNGALRIVDGPNSCNRSEHHLLI